MTLNVAKLNNNIQGLKGNQYSVKGDKITMNDAGR